MDLFLAGNLWHKWGSNFDSTINGGGLLILESFFYCDDVVEKCIPLFDKFMLDSGAYTFCYADNAKGFSQIDDYIERYIDFIKRNDIDLYFELDIDPIVGLKEVKRIRNRLEQSIGKRSIPVWHLERGREEFEKMCNEYDYVAIGGIADKGRTNIEKFIPALTAEAHKRGSKVHGLGYTNLKKLNTMGFDSVDSTAWLYGNMAGFVYQWDGVHMQKLKRDGCRLKDSRAVALHNFEQWVKMSQALRAR